jgi:hypothetical protein
MTCGDISCERATVVERAVDKLPGAAKKQAEQLLARAARTMHPSDLQIAAKTIREAAVPETLVADQHTTLVAETVARLLCDMSLHRVVTLGPSEVLDIGRHTRLWPAAIRRAVAMTYNGCTAHGCDRPAAFTDLHHVVHWMEGGPTALENLVHH